MKRISVILAGCLVALVVGAVIVSAQEDPSPEGETAYASYGLGCASGDMFGVVMPWGGHVFKSPDEAVAQVLEDSQVPEGVTVRPSEVAPAFTGGGFVETSMLAYALNLDGTPLSQIVLAEVEGGWSLEAIARCSSADSWHVGTAPESKG